MQLMMAGVVALAALQDAGGAGWAITDPVWRATPSGAQAGEAYPFQAMAHEKIGVAVVRCVAKADGTLTGCAVVCEGPAGRGFGKAALKLAGFYRMEPHLADGRSVEGGTVRVPFYFNPPGFGHYDRCEPVEHGG